MECAQYGSFRRLGFATKSRVSAQPSFNGSTTINFGTPSARTAQLSQKRFKFVVHASRHPPVKADDSLIDHASRWIWHKIQPKCCGECTAEKHIVVDWLDWLPEGIHKKLHGSESTAVPIVKEVIILSIFVSLFKHIESLCRYFNWIWATVMHKDTEITEESFQSSGFHALIAPARFYLVIHFLSRYVREFFPVLKIPIRAGLVGHLRIISFVAASSWFLLSWKQRLIQQWQKTASKADASILAASDRASSLIIIVLAIFTAAENLGIPVRSIMALGGITGIAIGLASKEVVTNFFGGLVLWFTRPFVIGDKIQASQFSGTVLDIGFFRTKLVGSDKSHISVPNQVFTNMVITNLSRATHKNLEVSFDIRTQDILKVDKITKQITDMLLTYPELDLAVQTPVCYVKSLNNLSVTVQIKAATKSMSNSMFYPIQQDIIVKAAEVILQEGAFLGRTAAFPHV